MFWNILLWEYFAAGRLAVCEDMRNEMSYRLGRLYDNSRRLQEILSCTWAWKARKVLLGNLSWVWLFFRFQQSRLYWWNLLPSVIPIFANCSNLKQRTLRCLHGTRLVRHREKKKFMLQRFCALKIEMVQFTYIMDDQKMNLLLSNVVWCSWNTNAFHSVFHSVLEKHWVWYEPLLCFFSDWKGSL